MALLRRPRRSGALLMALAALSLLAACGDDDAADPDPSASVSPGVTVTGRRTSASGSIEVLGGWSGVDRQNFEAMVQPWEESSGTAMTFIETGDPATELSARVDAGSAPDVAIPAELGIFQQFAREGKLAPLSECRGLEAMVRDEYPQAFVDLATVDGTLYGLFLKVQSKGAIFYNPSLFEEHGYEPLDAGASFDDLLTLSDRILADGTHPWSMGMEAGAESGFPGTDWIQQILINEHGAEAYDGVIDGSLPFTDEAMMDAWEKFGRIATNNDYLSQGSAEAVIATNFGDATYAPFEEPPGAAMVYEGPFAGGLIADSFPEAEAETDYDFFPFPGGAVTGEANIVYVFNMTDTVCSFLKHIAGADAQRIWVEAGGFTSVNKDLDLDAYPDPVSRKAAEQLLAAPAFRFDLDDAIGGAVRQAFLEGVLTYIKDPGSLESILEDIEAARQE